MRVLMHLMAPGAFSRVKDLEAQVAALSGLNAPFGARCFLTDAVKSVTGVKFDVLMRRLVLGAF